MSDFKLLLWNIILGYVKYLDIESLCFEFWSLPVNFFYWNDPILNLCLE